MIGFDCCRTGGAIVERIGALDKEYLLIYEKLLEQHHESRSMIYGVWNTLINNPDRPVWCWPGPVEKPARKPTRKLWNVWKKNAFLQLVIINYQTRCSDHRSVVGAFDFVKIISLSFVAISSCSMLWMLRDSDRCSPSLRPSKLEVIEIEQLNQLSPEFLA